MTPPPGVARQLPAPPPPVRPATSLLDGDTEREENLFIPPPVLKVRGEGIPSTTMILPPTDAEPVANPFLSQPPHSWRRAFLAGGLLGGLVVGALSFHAEVGRFVRARLHGSAPQPSVIVVPAPVPAPAPAVVPVPSTAAPTPPAPPPAAAVVEEQAPPPAAAAAEPSKPADDPAALAQRKPALAGDRRVPLHSTRLSVRPVARRKAGARPAGAATADEAPAAAKGDNWVDPFSDGTWAKPPSDEAKRQDPFAQ